VIVGESFKSIKHMALLEALVRRSVSPPSNFARFVARGASEGQAR